MIQRSLASLLNYFCDMLLCLSRSCVTGTETKPAGVWPGWDSQPCKDERLPRGNRRERRWYNGTPWHRPAQRAPCAPCVRARRALCTRLVPSDFFPWCALMSSRIGHSGRGLLRTWTTEFRYHITNKSTIKPLIMNYTIQLHTQFIVLRFVYRMFLDLNELIWENRMQTFVVCLQH